MKALREETEFWDRLILYLISNKFYNITRREWEPNQCQDEFLPMNDIKIFLKNKWKVLEKLELTKTEKH